VEVRLHSFTGDADTDSSSSSSHEEAPLTVADLQEDFAPSSGADSAENQAEQAVKQAGDPPVYPERKQVPRRVYFMGPDAM
jgi:hypothetical protein